MQVDAAKLVLSGLCGGGMVAIPPPQSPLPFLGGNEGVKRGDCGEFGRTGPEPLSARRICLLCDCEVFEGDVFEVQSPLLRFGFLGRGTG